MRQRAGGLVHFDTLGNEMNKTSGPAAAEGDPSLPAEQRGHEPAGAARRAERQPGPRGERSAYRKPARRTYARSAERRRATDRDVTATKRIRPARTP